MGRTHFRIAIFAAPPLAAVLLEAGCGGFQAQSKGNTSLIPDAIPKLLTNRDSFQRNAHSRERVLYNFRGGSDGANPWGDLLADNVGSLYGTTRYGGTYGDGTIFTLGLSGKRYTEKVLHSFYGGKDGASAWAGLIPDGGVMYTTTGSGGPADNGTVVKVVGQKESVRYAFKGGDDGAYPVGNLALANGALYGTTVSGGASGNGTVFSLSGAGARAERVLYSFKASGDGQHPHGGLIADASGALYGTATQGGAAGAGAVFKLTPAGSRYRESYLYSFSGGNGAIPNAGFVADASGALYSTASWGGGGSCDYGFSPYQGCGVVFKLTPKGRGFAEETVYAFKSATDGAGCNGDLMFGANGTLYGTTFYGGAYGKGTAFALTPHGKKYVKRTLWDFGGSGDGSYPAAGLVANASGTQLYGTTVQGGLYGSYFYGYGTVFELKP